MLKKILSLLTVFATIAMFSMPDNVFAFAADLECSTTYEVAVVHSNGSYTSLSCTNVLSEAQATMNAYSSTSTSVASVFKGTEIIDTKYGLLNLRKKTTSYITYMYPTSSAASDGGYDYGTYTNGNYGVYAAFTGTTTGTSGSFVAGMMQAGYKGYIRSWGTYEEGSFKNYDVVPISLISNAPYYMNVGGDIKHTYNYATATYSIAATTKTLGPAPSFMTENIKYYSFDGNYFYTSLTTMITDYKNNTYSNSVNATEPYFNYYQYLSNRTQTSYTAEDIDYYITNVRGYTAKATVYPAASYQSMLYDEGENFIYAQNKFGANALLTLGFGANESGWGKSSIAITKNNIFGYGANDSNPYGGSYDFASVRLNILYHADFVISSFYCDTETDSRYYGCHFGNKASGMNVKYASDPYWAEKMVANYYAIDKAFGLSDYNAYKIGIKTTYDTATVRKEPNTTSDIIYSLKNTHKNISIKNMPVVILEEVTGESVNGSTLWYKIQTDTTLDENRNAIANPASEDPRVDYNWDNNYGYVHSSLITTNDSYIHTSSKFYFNSLTWDDTTDTMDLSGFIVAEGTNNKASTSLAYSLILKNVDTNEEYILPLDRWTEDVPFTIPGESGFDYSGAWFKQSLDLSSVPEGDYDATIRVRTNTYEATAVLRNIFGEEMSHKGADDTGRGYQFRTNYYEKEMPLEIFIRDDGLISEPEVPNSTNMFNTYKDISLEGTSLNVRGTSYNVGVDYATDVTVERQIIFENIETYERFSFDIGSITDGDHDIVLRVQDGLSKTRAWFDGTMDLSTLPIGTYSIMIRTLAGTDEDAFELNDIFDRDLPNSITIDTKTVSLSLNKTKRYRLELTVE